MSDRVDGETTRRLLARGGLHLAVRAAAEGLFGADNAARGGQPAAWDVVEFDIVAALEGIRPGDERPLLEHPLAALVVQLVGQLVDAGFGIYDSRSGSSPGGVSVVPQASGRGVIVAWQRHDTVHNGRPPGRAPVYDQAVATMNRALREVLVGLGYTVEAFGQAGAHLVTSGPGSATTATGAAGDPEPARPVACRHDQAAVLAYLGDDHLNRTPASNGVPMTLADSAPEDWLDYRTTLALGRCADCGVLVVHVRMWDEQEPAGAGGSRRSDVLTPWVLLHGLGGPRSV